MSFHRCSASELFTLHIVRAAALTAALGVVAIISSQALAVTLYWDNDANPVGNTVSNTGGTLLGGTGTWNTTDSKWWDGVSSDVAWTDGNDALFYGAPNVDYTVTLSGNFAPNSLTFGGGDGTNVLLTGGTLTIGSPTNSIVMKTNLNGAARSQRIASVISGTDITVVADVPPTGAINAFLSIGANPTGVTNTFTGDLIFAGSGTPTGTGQKLQIAIDNPTALPGPAGPGFAGTVTNTTVRMKRNNSELLFGGAGALGVPGTFAPFTASFYNNIILNDGGSGTFNSRIGASPAGTVVTLGGVMSGNANLFFELGAGGGRGTIVLTNQSTYTGFTQINAQTEFVLRLGIDHALPQGTNFSSNRAFDMAGFDQRVGGLAGVGSAVITNSGGSQSVLTINGSNNGNYQGNIGPTGQDIALVLAPTNTGRLTLSRNVGTEYTGGTTIGGGTLVAASDASGGASATGSGPVAVNNGGTLGGGGGVSGAITVASGGHIAPSGVTPVASSQIGTLTAFGTATFNSGSFLDIDLGAPAPGPTNGASDRLNLPNPTALSVPAAASSIGVKFGDPAGGAAGNGTYTILSFQAGQYTGSNNASQFFTSSLPATNSLNGPTVITYHLADDNNVIKDGTPNDATRVIATVSGGPNALRWTGAVDGTWDVGAPASPFNFTNLGTGNGSAFANNDNVTFEDSGLNTNPIVVAAGGVQPNIITINNSGTAYSFSGGDIKGSSIGGGGGLYLAGTGAVTIDSKYTAAGPIVSNKTTVTGTATFNGAITAATSVTVNGGAVTLAGANTYTGNNIVNGGSLTASGASATFGAGNVTVNAGSAAIAAGVANAIANGATLTLLGGGTAATADVGFINLATGINEQVAGLVLGATPQLAGTYGATGSGATNINDEYFLGSGIITVAAPGLPGDFNSDGKVDAGDYATWRKNEIANAPLANDNSVGTQAARFSLWRANFGNPPGAGSGLGDGSAVPEPTSLLLSLVMVGSMLVVGRRKR